MLALSWLFVPPFQYRLKSGDDSSDHVSIKSGPRRRKNETQNSGFLVPEDFLDPGVGLERLVAGGKPFKPLPPEVPEESSSNPMFAD